MINDRGILIKNIYYMLTYAFQILRQNNYKEITTEDFENIHDMFACILGKGVAKQLKQGLYKEYVEKTENLYTIRGKLNLPRTISNQMKQKQMLTCEFDELSENNLLNQIIKTTLIILIKHTSVKAERKATLKKELLFFSEVDEIEPSTICWETIRFQRNNRNYRMLINVCKLILQGLLISNEKGIVKLASFIDEQRMCRLYEKFILEYYRYHYPELQANAMQIPWNLDDGVSDFLPVMKTDITIRKDDRILIIDAKYYAHTMQRQFDVNSIHSGNIYQIFTYVKNMDKDNTGNVAGMLLYAKTEEQIQPNNVFWMGGNMISVKTLDLNVSFVEIAKQLDIIVMK